MKIDCAVLDPIHLDPGYALLSVQNCFTAMELFDILDVHESERLNDVQFLLLMKNITNLGTYEIEVIFNLLDIDHSGEIEFDEFYLIFTILIASKDAYEKEFIYRHSKNIFQLIDTDNSGEVSFVEFAQMGILFSFDMSAIHRIFMQFDVSGDRNLDFSEFRLFTMACIDEARAQACRNKVKAFQSYHKRLLDALEPTLRRFMRTDCLPVPSESERIVRKVRLPYSAGKRHWTMPFTTHTFATRFRERREILRNYFMTLTGGRWCLFSCFRCLCCDFCCLQHPDDKRRKYECQWKCSCKCSCCACWVRYFCRLLGCCTCCCKCCPCHVQKKPKKGTEGLDDYKRYFPESSQITAWNWDEAERRKARRARVQKSREMRDKQRAMRAHSQDKDLKLARRESCLVQ